MPVPVMIGALLATIALILYLVGVLMMVFAGKVRKRNVVLQLTAVICDTAATVCMIIQTGGLIPHDLHGWIGYTALVLMLVELVFVLRHRVDGRADVGMRAYSAIAMVFWVASYSMGFVKMG